MIFLQKKVSSLSGYITILVAIIILFGLVFAYQYIAMQRYQQINSWKTYKNTEYGFQLTFPDSWIGYAVEKTNWQGQAIDGSGKTYSGPEIIVKNPQTTSAQRYQDIPIMVFTHDVWAKVSGNDPTIAVSAAPIGPAFIGQNANYVFATPPRWYGFTDAIGFQEAVNIVKTFKAF